MPPKVVASKKSQPSSAAVGVIRAKCPDNQSIVDQLYSIKLRIMKHTPHSQYSLTVKRAMESTKQHTVPIRNYTDFIALKYVGPTIAQQITIPVTVTDATAIDSTSSGGNANVNTEDHPHIPTTTATTKKVTKATKSKTAPKRTRVLEEEESSSVHDTTTQSSSAAAAAVVVPPPPTASQILPPPPKKRSRANATTNSNTKTTTTSDPGKKQIAYEQAVQASITWREQVQKQYERHISAATTAVPQHPTSRMPQLQWRVVLLIDIREQWCDYIQAKCTMSGIPCESRQLPIGDMMWIVQGVMRHPSGPHHNPSPQQQQPQVMVEFVIGTILERKTPEDLKSSIFGTRYMEQRLRLQHCGIPQIIYLLEGDIHRELYACPVSTIQTAIWETRLFMNFHVVHTNHADDTVVTLKRYHRRILQRTFPRAFGSHTTGSSTTTSNTEALPTFHESHRSRRRRSSISNDHNHNINEQQQQQQANRRRLRQRRQSLSELTFDMEPTVPFNMDRFISYQELCCKIQYDREMGRQSVHHIYTAMLKQVSTIYNSTKCNTITNQYPTIHDLCASYYESIRINHQNRIRPPQQNTNHDKNPGKYPTAQYMVTNLALVKDTNEDGSTSNNNASNNDDDYTKKSTTRRIIGVAKQKTLGHRSSNELYIAYTGGDTYLNECIQTNPTQFDRCIATTSNCADNSTNPTNPNDNNSHPSTTTALFTTLLPKAAPQFAASTREAGVDHGRPDANRNKDNGAHAQPPALDWRTNSQTMSDVSVAAAPLAWSDDSEFNQTNHTQQPTMSHDTLRPSPFERKVLGTQEIILLPDSDDDDDNCEICSSKTNHKDHGTGKCQPPNSVGNENYHPNRNDMVMGSHAKPHFSMKLDTLDDANSDADSVDDSNALGLKHSYCSKSIHPMPKPLRHTEQASDPHRNTSRSHWNNDEDSSDDSDDSVLDMFDSQSSWMQCQNHRPAPVAVAASSNNNNNCSRGHYEIIVLDDE